MFDSDKQVLLDPTVLQNNGKRVLDFTFNATLGTEETSHRLRPSEEGKSLVDAMGTYTVSIHPGPACNFQLTEAEGHARARCMLLLCHHRKPGRRLEVLVDFGFHNIAQRALLNEGLKSLEITILSDSQLDQLHASREYSDLSPHPSPILKTREDKIHLLR